VCDGNSRVCQARKISARILDDRINTLRRDSNSKRLYDRYRSEYSRNELEGRCSGGFEPSLVVFQETTKRGTRPNGPRAEGSKL